MTSNTSDNSLLDRIEAFLKKTGLSKTDFGKQTLCDSNLVDDIKNGRELRRASEAKIISFIENFKTSSPSISQIAITHNLDLLRNLLRRASEAADAAYTKNAEGNDSQCFGHMFELTSFVYDADAILRASVIIVNQAARDQSSTNQSHTD